MSDNEPANETWESQLQDTNVGADNFNFVQVTRAYLDNMRSLVRKSPLAQEILLYFVEHMGRTTNAVVCSYATLEEVTGKSRATIGRALRVLKDDNWIDAVKIGSATAYAVNARVFWQAGRNQKQYAMFTATVIASGQEQSSDFKEKAKQPLKHIPHVGKHERALVGNDDLPPPDQGDLDLN